jgi:hypothetical protein
MYTFENDSEEGIMYIHGCITKIFYPRIREGEIYFNNEIYDGVEFERFILSIEQDFPTMYTFGGQDTFHYENRQLIMYSRNGDTDTVIRLNISNVQQLIYMFNTFRNWCTLLTR